MNKINIKGTKYKIIITDKMEDGTVALCDKVKKMIYLNPKRNPKEQMLDLFHEIIHGLITEVGLDQCLNADIEEIIAENFSVFFYNLFNKKIK